jgi:glycosyltransferase involved in cell wall biosynthesis
MAAKHEVHYVSFRRVSRDFRCRHPSVRFYVTNLKFPTLGFRSLSSIIKGWLFLKRVLRGIKPDILFGGWIQRDGLICALTNYHPLLLMPWGSDALVIPFRNLFLRLGSSWIIRQADKITCDAEEVKSKLLDLAPLNPKDVVVFPWGIELNIFDSSTEGGNVRAGLGWKDEIILINTRGFSHDIYGMQTFIDVLPALCKKHPNLRVILCGSGPFEMKYRDLVNSYGLERKVHFTGYVQREHLPSYYAAADIYVSSSLTDGTSVSLLEAMSMGLPVAVSQVPAIMEWVKHGVNGLVFPPKDIEALSNSLEVLIMDENLREKFSKKNKEITLERADWEKNYEKLEGIFNDLVS